MVGLRQPSFSSFKVLMNSFVLRLAGSLIPEPLRACLPSGVSRNKGPGGNGSRVVAREVPAGRKREFSW